MPEAKLKLELSQANQRIAELEAAALESQKALIDSRNQELFLERMLDQSPYAIWVSDADGLMIKCNPALLRILNVTEEEVIGKYNVWDDPVIDKYNLREKVTSVF